MSAERAAAHRTCTFAAENLRFAIATTSAADVELVEHLFHDLRDPSATTGREALFTLARVDPTEPYSPWQVAGPRIDECVAQDLADAIARLLAGLSVATLDSAPLCLHLHAAAAVRGGRAVVIAASRNTGKTTTVTNLLPRGFSFITDETVVLSRNDDLVRGTPRPLSIKPGGLDLVEFLRPFTVPPAVDGDSYSFVPVGVTGARVEAVGVPHLVVLLRRPRIDGEPASSSQVHAADAVVRLMQETLDAERFGANAALRLARLAASSHCVEIVLGDPASTTDLFEELIASEPVVPAKVVAYPPSSAVHAHVVSVSIGDRAVLHHLGTGRILALDAAATSVWEVVGGWARHPGIDLDGPVVSTFVEQLRSHDLLASAGAAST